MQAPTALHADATVAAPELQTQTTQACTTALDVVVLLKESKASHALPKSYYVAPDSKRATS